MSWDQSRFPRGEEQAISRLELCPRKPAASTHGMRCHYPPSVDPRFWGTAHRQGGAVWGSRGASLGTPPGVCVQFDGILSTHRAAEHTAPTSDTAHRREQYEAVFSDGTSDPGKAGAGGPGQGQRRGAD